MKFFLKQFLFISFLTALLTLPFLTLAQISNDNITNKLRQSGASAGFDRETSELTLSYILGNIVNTVLSLLGVVFIILIIVGGYQWMTAGGNEEQVKKAQSRIKNAIIGLVIVISSYAIWKFIEKYLLDRI